MEVSFTINGKTYTVSPPSIPVETSLNTFIRTHAELHGTKFMCLEGGCGVCIVTLKGIHPATKKLRTWATNSCLTPIYSCDGLDIITVEGIGSKFNGYHPVQKRLADLNGTQCGYCSPGMVMNMYSLLEANEGKLTMEMVENSFGGNICRCTGYRPILDAFKSLSIDVDDKLKAMCRDIEDLPLKQCPKTGAPCAGLCHEKTESPPRHIVLDENKEWHKVYDLKSIFEILNKTSGKPYMLVSGNTAHGVYRRDRDIQVFIDVTGVEHLRTHIVADTLCIGANVNLTETMDILTEASTKHGYEYCEHMVKHIDLIANVPVRNNGSIAGNLSIKHQHIEFPSDVFMVLETAGATLTILEGDEKTWKTSSVADYLGLDMSKKVILNVLLPNLDPSRYSYRSYKIMPRAQNAHAYVNAGFLVEYQNDIVLSIRICFGGITPDFVHATKTEELLRGKDLYTNEVLREALLSLSDELHPDWILPDASPDYRKNLALSLFYKFVISTCPEGKVKPEYLSGGEILQRSLSSGTQTFDTYKEKWPLTQPVPKYEAYIQTAGEALYSNDMAPIKDELWAAFVLATKPHARIAKIDASDVLKTSGVVAFYSAKDIPGKNNFSPPLFNIHTPEEVFVGDNSEILFNGQPAGIVVAETMDLALHAANQVKITYIDKATLKMIKPTITDMSDVSTAIRFRSVEGISQNSIKANIKTIRGNMQIGSQFHFSMEPQTTVCVPAEDGIDVYSSTQYIDFTNVAIAECLNIPQNAVNMTVRRIGGAFGAKITRSSQVACACAIACHLINRPVRFVQSIESNMITMGKRFAVINEYECDFDETGKIHKLRNTYAEDNGYCLNESVRFLTDIFFNNCYVHDGWDNKGESVVTDAPSHTWFRGPGSTEGLSMIENIIEHIARAEGLDPIAVRLANIADDNEMKKLLPQFVKDVEYYERKKEIDEFNTKNRWRKRGIAIVPMEYPIEYIGPLPAYVAVYHSDGSVAITHGGIECGQGINTKVAQVAAHVLGVPLDMVSVKPANNVVSANAWMSGGSITSECVCYSVKVACEEINKRMQPIRDEMKDKSWAEITTACFWKNIDMTAKYTVLPTELKKYTVWGVCCCEIEIDILTGNLHVKRVDLLEDTGESMSPNVDVGQVEGSYIMGLGYWLTEILVYNRINGELLSNRTWTYKPPGPKDIPIDFRIKFLQKSSNPFGVLRSKATGEPALCMSYNIIIALRYALDSARKDAGGLEYWYNLGAPSTPDILFLNAGNSYDAYTLT